MGWWRLRCVVEDDLDCGSAGSWELRPEFLHAADPFV